MNKNLYAVLLTTTTIFSLAATDPFASLAPSIKHSANKWISNTVSKLDTNKQVTLLNFFVPEAFRSDATMMKCSEAIQEDQTLTPVLQEFLETLMKFVELYHTNMMEKFNALKTNNQDDMKNFQVKLNQMLFALIPYAFQIYYTELYKHIEKNNPTALCFIFDENGLLAQEKRTRALPKPTV